MTPKIRAITLTSSISTQIQQTSCIQNSTSNSAYFVLQFNTSIYMSLRSLNVVGGEDGSEEEPLPQFRSTVPASFISANIYTLFFQSCIIYFLSCINKDNNNEDDHDDA